MPRLERFELSGVGSTFAITAALKAVQPSLGD